MKKKNWLLVAALVLAGAGVYFWQKNKKKKS